MAPEALAKLKVGETIGVETFTVGELVDVTGTTKGRGFSGVIRRHHFSSNRASHGNSRSHNTPGSIGMAQDPGRVFPGKRMAGQYGNVTRTVQTLTVVRVDAERGLLLVKGSRARRRRRPHHRPAVGEDAGQEGGLTMDLKLIDDKGQASATVAGSDALFGRDYNEALIHQVVTAYQANARQGTRKQKGRADINKSHKKPWAQKGTGRARAGQANSPLWRGGGKIFPSLPDENFSQKVNRKMYRAGHRVDPVAARSRGPAVGDRRARRRVAEDQAVRAEDQGAGPDRHACWSSPTSSTTTCSCRRATCRTCWCSRRAKSIR